MLNPPRNPRRDIALRPTDLPARGSERQVVHALLVELRQPPRDAPALIDVADWGFHWFTISNNTSA
jgi:hypothetical protein